MKMEGYEKFLAIGIGLVGLFFILLTLDEVVTNNKISVKSIFVSCPISTPDVTDIEIWGGSSTVNKSFGGK